MRWRRQILKIEVDLTFLEKETGDGLAGAAQALHIFARALREGHVLPSLTMDSRKGAKTVYGRMRTIFRFEKE